MGDSTGGMLASAILIINKHPTISLESSERIVLMEGFGRRALVRGFC